ncbi:MAG TPA: gamma-glutamylcyclotransferase family protein [Pyrinomonadaceae bacterium]|nr:gamma-glutamylcyclotransferase family protein [Pyrinomonadaceae bacterium]
MHDYLFVYGTLRPSLARGESAQLIERLRYVGPATVPGQLYDLGPYAGAIVDQSSTNTIKGDLFELPNDDSVLEALDDYEDIDRADPQNSLFIRIRVIASMTDGRPLNSWIYVYNRDPGNAPLIAGGDFSKSGVA